MITHIKTKQEFQDFIKEGSVVVDFFATWCGPCRMLAPVLEDIDEEYKGTIKIAKVDVDELSEIAEEYMVQSIPTLLFLKDGVLKEKQIGFVPANSIVKMIESTIK